MNALIYACIGNHSNKIGIVSESSESVLKDHLGTRTLNY